MFGLDLKKIVAAFGLCAFGGCASSGASGSALLVAPLTGSPGVPVTPSTPFPSQTAFPISFLTKWGLELAISETCPADLTAALAVRASVIRVQYLPALLPKSCFDRTYAAAARANLTVVWITPAVDLNAAVDYASYAQTMATAAAGYPHSTWEVMNEPDLVQPQLKAQWPNQQVAVEEYVALVHATAPAIHAADPTAIVITGGPSGFESRDSNLPWLHASVNVAPFIDGVGFHPYSGFELNQVRTLESIYGKPVYITEWETENGGVIESVLQSFSGLVPLFVYCSQACVWDAATPIFPQ